jgi:Serine hydrolase (FSH1)
MFTPGMERISSPGHLFYAFYNPEDLSTFRDTIEQLHKYISAEGPFDAVMGFSGGAVLAASYIMQEEQSQRVPPFQCAIFLSSAASVVELTYLGLLDDHGDVLRNSIIRMPTVHIWGVNDRTAPSGGADLSKLCDPTQRLTMVHNGAHEFPRGDCLTQAVHCIRRAVHAAT